MSTLDRAIVEMSADVDGDGNTENGRFHMVGNVTVSEQVEPDYWFGGRGSTINSVINRTLLDKAGGRQQFYLDLGAGSHIHEIEFMGWEGAKDSDGNDVLWGDPNAQKGTVANATSQDALVQMQTFNKYLKNGIVDSFSPAYLHVGEWTDGIYNNGDPIEACNGEEGLFGKPLKIVLMGPRMVKASEEFKTFNGSYQAVETLEIDQFIDSTRQEYY